MGQIVNGIGIGLPRILLRKLGLRDSDVGNNYYKGTYE